MTRPGSAGFTLIETIVVVVILGLALTIVAGFIPRRNSTLELSTASQSIASTLRLARARAITESRSVAVAAAADGRTLMADGVRMKVPDTVAVAMAGTPAIRFAPDGSASGGGIRVRNASRERLVSVDWLTGRVSVAEMLVTGATQPR